MRVGEQLEESWLKQSKCMRYLSLDFSLANTKEKIKMWHFSILDWGQFSSVQLLSCVRLFVTPWIAACEASLSITNSRSSRKLMSIESVMPSNHLILCRPLLLLPPLPPSIRVFSNESTLRMRWPKYWSFSFSIIPSKEQDRSPLEWTGWISLQSKGLSRVFPTPQFKSISSSMLSFLHSPTLTSTHDH